MKKLRFVLTALALSAALGAGAEVLYWMTEGYTDTLESGSYALLYTKASDQPLDKLWLQTGETYIYGYTDVTAVDKDSVFYVSIYNKGSSDPLFSGSEKYAASYKDLLAGGFIRNIDAEGAVGSHWNAAAPIPEPTGGVLLLLGLSALALRRKESV